MSNLNLTKLLETAERIIADEHGRLQMASSCDAFVQEIMVDDKNYRLSIALQWAPGGCDEYGNVVSLTDDRVLKLLKT